MKRNLVVAGLVLGLFTTIVLPTQAESRTQAVQAGYTLLERGWVNDAIVQFQQAVRQNPQSVEGQLGLAIAYQRAGQDTNAWATYLKVLELEPNQQQALTAVGELGGYRSEWNDRGIQALTQLLMLEPANLTARSRRATLYGYQGQFAEAIADYELVLSQNPTPDVILSAAQTYIYSGDYPYGLALFDRYRNSHPTIPDTAFPAYALALQKMGQVDVAIAQLEPRLQARSTLDATTIQLRAALAMAYQANDQTEQAVATLEPLRNQKEAALTLARALTSMGRQANNPTWYEQGLALYQQVLQQTPQPSMALVIEVADGLSESPEHAGQALSLYQQALQQQPDQSLRNQSLQVKLLILEYQVGQRSRNDLVTALQQALQSLPERPAAQRPIAQALIKLDPPEVSLLPIYEALGSSQVPFIYFRVAQIHLQQQDLAAAQQAIATYRNTPIGQADPATELILAEIERRQGNLEASAERYTRLIDSAPPAAILDVAWRGLASIRVSQGKFDEARAIYRELLRQNPQDLLAQVGQAYLDYQAQRILESAAQAILTQWLSTEATPDIPPEVLNLTAALPASPDRESLYRVVLTADPTNIAIQRRWVQLLSSRDPDQATAYLADLMAHNPDNLNLYFVQGELAQMQGHLDQAAIAYQAILAQDPDNLGALSALGGVRFQQRRYTEATALYQQVLALQSDDREARRVLAELSLAQDQPLAALEQFRQLQQDAAAAGNPDPVLEARIAQIQADLMKRRGFQPAWERY